jgi:hypothetical protein
MPDCLRITTGGGVKNLLTTCKHKNGNLQMNGG